MSHEFSDGNQVISGRSDNDLISADRVAGTNIYDEAGERLGEVHSIMIDKVSGEVAYVMISFGGILGFGEKYHPLPWDMLAYDTQIDGYRVDIDRAELEGAPAYDSDELAGFDTSRGDDVDRFYGREQRGGAATFAGNRSDLNDGVERPLGFYSRKAQSLRNGDAGGTAGSDTEGLKADEAAPGFFSPEQQKARSEIGSIDNTVGGAQGVHAREVDSKVDSDNDR
jgi:sporulation protein YlmC with PRC-barrel domain